MHEVYKKFDSLDIEEYNKKRREKKDKSLLKFDTFAERFFGGDDSAAQEAQPERAQDHRRALPGQGRERPDHGNA